jgi:hypothetical protein
MGGHDGPHERPPLGHQVLGSTWAQAGALAIDEEGRGVAEPHRREVGPPRGQRSVMR